MSESNECGLNKEEVSLLIVTLQFFNHQNRGGDTNMVISSLVKRLKNIKYEYQCPWHPMQLSGWYSGKVSISETEKRIIEKAIKELPDRIRVLSMRLSGSI